MRPARAYSGKIRKNISPRERIELASNCTAAEECFSILQYYSEVEEVGLKFIGSFGHRRKKEVYLQFQSFIRQAKSFYESAEKLHYRSSALLYYYSFLNLAKALITLKEPHLVKGKTNHGIKPGNLSDQFNQQTLKILNDNGVFSHLYKEITGEKLNNAETRVSLVRLLGYCTDITYENYITKLSEYRWEFSTVPVRIRLVANEKTKKCWPTIALPAFTGMNGYRRAFKDFFDYFEEVEFTLLDAIDIFNADANNLKEMNFFESKAEYPLLQGKFFPPFLKEEVFESIKNHYLSRPYQDEFDFSISIPLRPNNQKPFNEPLAIYCVMFFLGNLVRYHPRNLEKQLATKPAWVLERFVQGCSVTFLRHMTNFILNKDYIYISR
jgi:hypothetical protein